MTAFGKTLAQPGTVIGRGELDALNRDLRALLKPAASPVHRSNRMVGVAIVAAIVCAVLLGLIYVQTAGIMRPGATGRSNSIAGGVPASAGGPLDGQPQVVRGSQALASGRLDVSPTSRPAWPVRHDAEMPARRPERSSHPSAASLIAGRVVASPDVTGSPDVDRPTADLEAAAAAAAAAVNRHNTARRRGHQENRRPRVATPARNIKASSGRTGTREGTNVVAKGRDDHVDTANRQQRRRDRQDALDAVRALQLQ